MTTGPGFTPDPQAPEATATPASPADLPPGALPPAPPPTDAARLPPPPPVDGAWGAAGAGTAAWAPPAPAKPRSPVAVAVIAVAATAVLAMTSWITAGRYAAGAGDAARGGYWFGAMLGSLLVALVARFIVVKLRKRGEPVLSFWVLVLAAVWSLFPLGSAVGRTGAPLAAVDPVPHAVIAAPYRLGPAPAEVEKAMGGGLTGRTVVVKEVAGPDGSVSYLLVMSDAGMRWADYDAGVRRTGGTSTPTSVGAVTDARYVQGDGQVALAWLTGGLFYEVLAIDEPTARAIAQAVQQAQPAS